MSKPGSDAKRKDEPPKIDDAVFNIFANLKSTLESETAGEEAKTRESRIVARTSELRLRTSDEPNVTKKKKSGPSAKTENSKSRTRNTSPAASGAATKGKGKSGASKDATCTTTVSQEDVSVEQKPPTPMPKKKPTTAVKPHMLEGGTVIMSSSGKKFTVKSVMQRHGSRLFGHFYAVEDGEQKMGAMKTEMKTPTASDRMFAEALILVRAQRYRGIFHFPTLIDLGETRDFRFLITDAIGWSLEEIIMFHKIEPKTALTLSIETFEAIEELHLMGFIHRDIKPANFAVGVNENKHRVYLVEMQLAVAAPDPRTKTAANYKFIGSQRYASRAAHQGKTSRTARCDIESWLYMCIDFFDSDSLPWGGLDNKEATCDLKEKMFKHHQTVLNILPKKFEEIVREVSDTRSLSTNYVLIHETLKTMATEMEIDLDAPFEFELDETLATTAHTGASTLQEATKSSESKSNDDLIPVPKSPASKSPLKNKKKKGNKKKKKKGDEDDGATVDEEEEVAPTKSPAKKKRKSQKKKKAKKSAEDPGVDVEEE